MLERVRVGIIGAAACCLAAIPFSAALATGAVPSPSPLAPVEPLIDAKLTFYNEAFPDIQFVALGGGRTADAELRRLDALLGDDARTQDYAHPPELGRELTGLARERVALMLHNSSGSASLFRVGGGAQASRPNLCVLTLDGESIAADDVQATRHLLDVSDQNFADIPRERYLKSTEHLAFVIDHEVFHCLDAFYNGPIPMSDQRHAASYAAYRNESGADAFGIAMRLREHDDQSYVSNLMRIRALTLIQQDPDHFTDRSMRRVLEVYPGAVRDKSVQELFDLATRIRDREVSDYGAYLAFRAAALRASEQLGAPVSEENRETFSGVEPDVTMTDALIYRVLTSYRQLFARGD